MLLTAPVEWFSVNVSVVSLELPNALARHLDGSVYTAITTVSQTIVACFDLHCPAQTTLWFFFKQYKSFVF